MRMKSSIPFGAVLTAALAAGLAASRGLAAPAPSAAAEASPPAYEIGFQEASIPMRDGDATPIGLSLDREQMRAFLSDPVLARELSQPVKCLPQKGEEICGTGRRTCLISPYGDLFPCGVHPIPAGNLREKSFQEIWTGSPLLRDLRTKTVDDLRGGAKRDIAGFRCSALALIEDGDFLGPFRRGEEMAEIQAEAARVNGR